MFTPTLLNGNTNFYQNIIVSLSLSYAAIYKELPLVSHLLRLRRELQTLRCQLDTSPELIEDFCSVRKSVEYQSVFDTPNPLISVCIATFDRADLLTKRALASILNQTYTNLEVIVVGDHCTDETSDRLSRINDPRLKFYNLPKRGDYPELPKWRWMVAGTAPINHALALAKGDFITHIDDDDEQAPNRIEKLLSLAQEKRADLVWHPFWFETKLNSWRLKTALDFRANHITTSSVFYHRWFARIPWNIEAWRSGEPGDWNRFRKFEYIGANLVRHPDALLKHYREHTNAGLLK
jgi:hypothetical protein